MQERLLLLPKDAKDKATETKKFFNKLKKRIPKDLDKQVAAIHDEVFEKRTVYLVQIVVRQLGLYS